MVQVKERSNNYSTWAQYASLAKLTKTYLILGKDNGNGRLDRYGVESDVQPPKV